MPKTSFTQTPPGSLRAGSHLSRRSLGGAGGQAGGSSSDHTITVRVSNDGGGSGDGTAPTVRVGFPSDNQLQASAAAAAAEQAAAKAQHQHQRPQQPSPPPSSRGESAFAGRATAAAAAAADDGGGGDEEEAGKRGLLAPLLAAADGAGERQQQQHGDPYDDRYPATTAARRAAAAVAAALHAKRRGGSSGSGSGGLLARAEARDADAAALARRLRAASALSWAVNIGLLAAKVWAFTLSGSKAVLASAADSAVDLVSQVVITWADSAMRRADPRFPVGRARLEALGVLACACIMSVASFEVISESCRALYEGLARGEPPGLDLSVALFVVLGVAIGSKALCYVVCAALAGKSDSMLALAEDHLNDCASNAVAVVAALAAGTLGGGGGGSAAGGGATALSYWWLDPAGAIAISSWIVARWVGIASQQVDKLVGRGAPREFVATLEALAAAHHAAMGLDCLRAYHMGARYIVELEVVCPADMTVRDSHDISLELQHRVEAMDEVERCFVHVDYARRDGLEHKVERELALASASSA